ncbi:MAG: Hsp70 family protein [Clostridia bacterium]|nr:Hsp70 family protein [Clostridia bacterium]
MKILGFDLGDGESAVTILDEASTVEPRVIPIDGKVSILSAVGDRDGKIVVGEAASVLLGSTNTQVRFKSRYLTDPGAHVEIRRFAQGVCSELTRTEPALMAEVSSTVVGCPAGWGEGRRAQYAALMESAGFPNVSVVPESRAAFMYARHARGLRVDPALMQKSAMVIDVGSSTTDFAYIVDGHQQSLSLFGNTSLGGGLMDDRILEKCVNLSRDRDRLREVMAESPAWHSYCELEARRLKERYFLDEEKWKETPLKKRIVVCYKETLSLELQLDAQMVHDLITEPIPAIGGRSFLGCLQDALNAAVQVSRDNPPKVVILTGGASRMMFLQEECRAAFKDSLLILCPEPECSIARGLAYCGRVDENLRVFRNEVASMARGEVLNTLVNKSVHELYEPIAKALYETAVESVVETVNLWKRGGIDTIDELDSVLTERISRDFSGEAVRERLTETIRDWLDRLTDKLQDQLMNLCYRCGVPPEKMTLNSTHVDTGLNSVDLSLTDAMGMDILSGIIGVVLAAVGAALCGGGGVAILGTGPVGMIVGASAGLLLALLGKSTLEKALRGVHIPLLIRAVVTEGAVRNGLKRQEKAIEGEIIRALADPRTGFAARLSSSLAETLGAQMEKLARDAEMSITA